MSGKRSTHDNPAGSTFFFIRAICSLAWRVAALGGRPFTRSSQKCQLSRRHLLQATAAVGLGLLPGFGTSLIAAPNGPAVGQPPVKIMVVFSWSFVNIGDIAITPGIFRLLQEHIPGVRITLIANSHVDEYREYLDTRFPDVRVLPTPFRSTGEPASKEFLQAFDQADLLLFNSGTTLSFGRWDRNWNRAMKFWMPIFMARETNKPYGIYCQSFEKFAPPSDLLLPKTLSNAEFVFCRDTNSLQYLKSLGVRPPVLEYGPDSTFAFNLRDEPFADRFLTQHQLQPRKFITLTIRSSLQGFIDKKREQNHAAKLRKLVTEYVRKTGEQVLLCPEVYKEIEPSRRLILEPLPDDVKAHIRFMDAHWLPEQAFSVYARARAIVSMEMHSIIMALAAGTPVLHPTFAEAGRKRFMLPDLGLGKWLFDIDGDPAEPILAAALAIHDDFPAARKRVESAMAIVHNRQVETMAIVRKTAQQQRP